MPQLDVAVGLERLRGRTGAAAAAADEPDAQLITVRRGAEEGGKRDFRSDDASGGRRGRGLEELAASGGWFGGHVSDTMLMNGGFGKQSSTISFQLATAPPPPSAATRLRQCGVWPILLAS